MRHPKFSNKNIEAAFYLQKKTVSDCNTQLQCL